jgi:hypothetical protein
MTGLPGWESGSWLFSTLESSGFGNNVSVQGVQSYTSAKTLDELVDNMMIAAPMFVKGITEEEERAMRPILRKEFEKLGAFEVVEEGVRIGMTAWVGVGWK